MATKPSSASNNKPSISSKKPSPTSYDLNSKLTPKPTPKPTPKQTPKPPSPHNSIPPEVLNDIKENVFSKTAAEHFRLAKSVLPSFKMSSKSKTLGDGSWARPFRFEPNFKEYSSEGSVHLTKLELSLNTSISCLVNATIVQPSFILAYIKAAILSQEAGNGCYYSSIQYLKQALSHSELMPQEQINWCNYRIGLAYFLYGQKSMSPSLVDFSIDYLSICLAKDYKGYHYDALLYRGVCYLYSNKLDSAYQDLEALAILLPDMTNLVSNIKTQFEANPVFVVSSKQTYDT